VHTYTYTCTCTCTYTYAHTYIHTDRQTYIHTYIHIYLHIYIYTYTEYIYTIRMQLQSITYACRICSCVSKHINHRSKIGQGARGNLAKNIGMTFRKNKQVIEEMSLHIYSISKPQSRSNISYPQKIVINPTFSASFGG
jgi:hypothetical protein